MEAITELWTWLASLDATFAFLVLLPFAVAALGLAALALERKQVARPRRASAPAERAGRAAHVH